MLLGVNRDLELHSPMHKGDQLIFFISIYFFVVASFPLFAILSNCFQLLTYVQGEEHSGL